MNRQKYAPQLANPYKGKFASGGWYIEPKFDGHRVVIAKLGADLSIFTRTFHEQVGKFPHIEESLRAYPTSFVLDGELISVAATTTINGMTVPISSFESALSVVGSDVARAAQAEDKLVFMAFDCLHAEGRDLFKMPEVLRRKQAEKLVEQLDNPYIDITPRWEYNEDNDYFGDIVACGGEGVMLKNGMAPYQPGKRPTDTWYKLKANETADVVITGFVEGKGKWRGYIGSIEFGQYKNGRLVRRGSCSGMSDAMRLEISQNRESFLDKVIEIRYFGRVGPEQNFRHPNFVTIRNDKLPTDCVWE